MNKIDLIHKCKNNNRKAQAELYHLYKDKLFCICLKYCNNTKDAEDVLQDVFITIFKKINTFKTTGNFEGWIKRITINKAIDKYHKTKITHLPIIDDIIENTIESVDFEKDIYSYSLDYILKIIQDLPIKYRLVFSLYELDDYSHKEIAILLNISTGTSKSNLHRAKLILKKKLISNKKSNLNYG